MCNVRIRNEENKLYVERVVGDTWKEIVIESTDPSYSKIKELMA
jgi:hypothetical protein